MSIMKLNTTADTERQPVFYLDDVLLLPHYSEKHRWVGPGYPKTRLEYTTAQLAELQARLSTKNLWKRYWTDEVKGWIAL
jgi:hypothetical protein